MHCDSLKLVYMGFFNLDTIFFWGKPYTTNNMYVIQPNYWIKLLTMYWMHLCGLFWYVIIDKFQICKIEMKKLWFN